MLRLLGFNEGFRLRDGLEAELTRHHAIAGVNANVEAFSDERTHHPYLIAGQV